MPDSRATEAEREAQPRFRFVQLLSALALLAAIGLFDSWMEMLPSRRELGPRIAAIHFDPVDLGTRSAGPLRIAGAWRVTSVDPRLGGISALAVDRGHLLALSDSGVLIRFAPPGTRARAEIRELPAGPGSGSTKLDRDSEAMASDPQGRGWWVAFEQQHGLRLFDQAFRRGDERVALNGRGWRRNRGIEAMVAEREGLLLFPEAGGAMLRIAGSEIRGVAHIGNGIADAVPLGRGHVLLLERNLTPFGFSNVLVLLERRGSGYRQALRIKLPLGPLDNAEALAVQHKTDGSLRLWLMTDDNFQRPLRTLLVALDGRFEQPRAPASAGIR